MAVDPSTTKYLIHAKLEADGVVEKPDVVGAVFGQTEGLLGEEMELRDLQKSGRIGRLEVEVQAKKGKSEGMIYIPSSLDQVETAILASALETIDRVGPCKARIEVQKVEDVRLAKRTKIVERARALLGQIIDESKHVSTDITEEVRHSVQVAEVVTYGPDRLPAGPNVEDSDSIIVVEGRSDVINLLKCGIKNVIALEGTSVPRSVVDLAREKTLIAFVDGDRGGDLILKELLQVAEVDFIARAPRGKEVEELPQKQVTKLLRNKMPVDQYKELYGLEGYTTEEEAPPRPAPSSRPEPSGPRPIETPRAPPKPLSPQAEKYRSVLAQLNGSLKARLFDEAGTMKAEVQVRELAETLRSNAPNVRALVFDGVVTQRILDLASEIGVQTVIGTKLWNISKVPSNVEVFTKDDLGI